jgi:hypothetical protein
MDPMIPAHEELAFSWTNYAPQHRPLIALRSAQAKRLHRCSLCGRSPIIDRRVLVHVALRSVGAEALDPKPLVRSLALCKAHSSLSGEELADYAWPGWRDTWG